MLLLILLVLFGWLASTAASDDAGGWARAARRSALARSRRPRRPCRGSGQPRRDQRLGDVDSDAAASTLTTHAPRMAGDTELAPLRRTMIRHDTLADPGNGGGGLGRAALVLEKDQNRPVSRACRARPARPSAVPPT